MGLRDKIKKQGEVLKQQQSEDAKKSSTGEYSSILLTDKIPKGRSKWIPKSGVHVIDVIPFFIGGRHPTLPKGTLQWTIRVSDHTRIGVLDESFVCPANLGRKPCPIEEYIQKMGKGISKEDKSKIKAKNRNVLLVWVHDSPEEEAKGIQIWYTSHFFFGKHIDKICERPRGGGILNFWDPDNGKSIVFEIEKKGDDNLEYVGHRFEDREEPIPDSILDQSFPVDEIIKWESGYAEIYEAFYSKPYNPGEKENPSTTRSLPKSLPAEEPQGVEEETMSEETRMDEEAEVLENELLTEVGDSQCPSGYSFGDVNDIDTHEECKGCTEWDACADAIQNKHSVPKEEPKKEEPKKVGRRLVK